MVLFTNILGYVYRVEKNIFPGAKIIYFTYFLLCITLYNSDWVFFNRFLDSHASQANFRKPFNAVLCLVPNKIMFFFK